MVWKRPRPLQRIGPMVETAGVQAGRAIGIVRGGVGRVRSAAKDFRTALATGIREGVQDTRKRIRGAKKG